ncbi:MAG: hypothetical protein NVS3B10_25540 [Polyangiales bacterium]
MFGERDQVLDDPRIERREHRHELLPDAHAQVASVAVGRVVGKGEAPAGGVRGELTPSRVAPRSEEVLGPLREDGKPGERGAAHEADEHGLGAVVGVVAGGDEGSACGPGGGAKGREPGVAGACLEVRASTDVDLRAGEGDAPGEGEVLGAMQFACPSDDSAVYAVPVGSAGGGPNGECPGMPAGAAGKK